MEKVGMETASRRFELMGVALIGIAGLAVNLAGWRARPLDLDWLPFVDGALRFLETGTPPLTGSLLSMGAYTPPLSTWLFMPGVALFDHPGNYVMVGSGALYLGTLAGIFVLAQRHAGTACGYLAVSLFAFSKIGQHFASFIGGWTFFFIWVLYFASRWVFDRDAKYLAASLLVWCVGMYNMMIIAPLLFVFPVLWLVYRPPVTLRPLLAAGAIALFIWSPYLLLQSSQEFSGLIAQLTRSSLIPADFERSWCDPSWRPIIEARLGGIGLTGQSPGLAADGPAGFLKWLGVKAGGRLSVVMMWLTGNMSFNLGHPLPSLALELAAAAAVMGMLLIGLAGDAKRLTPGPPALPRALPAVIGLVLLAVGLAVNEFTVTWLVSRDGHLWSNEITIIRQFQAMLLLAGAGILLRRRLGRALRRLAERAAVDDSSAPSRESLRVLAYAFLVPSLFLLLLADPSRERYFHWLWPLQCLFIAMFTLHVLPRLLALGPGRAGPALLAAALLVLVCWPPFLRTGRALAGDGFGGRESAMSRSLGLIAETLRAEGRDSAAIGYNITFPGYNIAYNVLDPRYKVGGALDFLLRRRHGIDNLDRCAEGVHPDDEFRIVTAPPEGRTMSVHLDLPEDGFETMATLGGVRVLRRR